MKRFEYVHEEDVKIVQFLAYHEAWELTNGNKIWQLMVQENICPQRTFQSLRNRFLRGIKPRLLTEFASIVNASPLPRHFKSSLSQGKLKDQLETVKKKSPGKSAPKPEKRSKENVTPERPESPSLIELLAGVSSPQKHTEEVVDSCEANGWIAPHCTGSSKNLDTQTQQKRRRLYNDDIDVFSSSEGEPDQHPDDPAHEPASQPFVSLSAINEELTQIVPEPVPAEEPPGNVQAVTSSKRRFAAILKKKRRRNEQNRLFQQRLNKISQQLSKIQRKHQNTLNTERRKYQQFVSFVTDCLMTSSPEHVAQIPEILDQAAAGNENSSTLLHNMLHCLDENTRNKILELRQGLKM